MLEQYWALKREAGDALLLYRLGDFYEMFFEDAAYAAPLLGLVLTARHKDSDVEAPMCGIPQHALEPYRRRLAGEALAEARRMLTLVFTTHPVAAPLLDSLRRRTAPDTSGPRPSEQPAAPEQAAAPPATAKGKHRKARR